MYTSDSRQESEVSFVGGWVISFSPYMDQLIAAPYMKSILEKGLDRRPLEEVQETSLVATHENLRGPHYYGHREACSSC